MVKIVQRTKAEMIEEFEGTVKDVTVEPSQLEDVEQEQYHIQIEPKDKTILKDSKTGMFHEWIRMSPKATDTTVPEGSIADRYIQEVEMVLSEAKKLENIAEVFALLKGKSFLFKRKVLGKSYEGKESKPKWIPVKLLE